jgi:hypothetical protein
MESFIHNQKKNKPKRAKKRYESTFQRIWNFYYDQESNTFLTERENQIRERWEMAYIMLCGMSTKSQVAKKISKLYSIYITAAYRDITKAVELFGEDPKESSKEAKRTLASEWIVMAIKRAWNTQNYKALEMLIYQYNKLHGLEDHSENPLLDLISENRPTEIRLSADPKVFEKELADLLRIARENEQKKRM